MFEIQHKDISKIKFENFLQKDNFKKIMEDLILALTTNKKHFAQLKNQIQEHLEDHITEIEIVNRQFKNSWSGWFSNWYSISSNQNQSDSQLESLIQTPFWKLFSGSNRQADLVFENIYSWNSSSLLLFNKSI